MSTCNWLDLQTLGSQLVMPKNLPDHCSPHMSNKKYTKQIIQTHAWVTHAPITPKLSSGSNRDVVGEYVEK